MRVLMLSHLYPRRDAPLFGEFIHRQARALAAAGADVTVVAPIMRAPWFTQWRPHWNRLRHVPVSGWKDGVRIYRPRYWSPPGMHFHFIEGQTIRSGIRSLCHDLHREEPFDVIHANRLFPEGYAALELSENWGIPLLAMARGMDLNRVPHWGEIYRRAIRRVAVKADAVLSVSQGLLNDMERFSPPARQSRVVYNGCEALPRGKSKRALRKRHGLPLNGVLALYVGRLEEAKGCVELFRAMGILARRNPELHLVTVGKVHAKDTVNDSAQSGWADRIHVLGERPHAEVREIMRACDLFVFPSWREGVPNAVLEAMGHGLPVVATRAGGTAEVLPPDAGYLVDVGDLRELTEKAGMLSRDARLRRRMGGRGADHVARTFSWGVNAQVLLTCYQEAIHAGRECS